MVPLFNQRSIKKYDPALTRIWQQRLLILLTILSALILIGLVIWGASHIATTLLIFAIAGLIAYAIVPAVRIFQRFMPRIIAILLVYLIVFLILSVLLYLVINTAIDQLGMLAKSIRKLVTPGSGGADSPLVDLLERLGLSKSQISSSLDQLERRLSAFASTAASGIIPLVSRVTDGVINIVLTIIVSIYLLLDGSALINWLREKSPRTETQSRMIGSSIDTLQNVVGGYIRGQLLLSFVVAVSVGIGMALLGMPYAMLLGVLSFFTEFIPVLGSLFTGVISVLLALTHGWLMAILVLSYFILVHIFEGYILSPRLVGRAVGLHPLISLLAFMIGAELFGPWGAIFASPIAGLIQAFVHALWLNRQKPEDAPVTHVLKEVEDT